MKNIYINTRELKEGINSAVKKVVNYLEKIRLSFTKTLAKRSEDKEKTYNSSKNILFWYYQLTLIINIKIANNLKKEVKDFCVIIRIYLKS